jgi:CheY-like chemotaxis protein
MGYADLAEKKAGDERMKSYLSNIRTASEKASHLTRQLLAFARKQIITPRIVSLAAVIEDGEKMLRRLIGEDTELLFRVRHDFPKVKIDPNQFEQVLINLVVNAHVSMASGGRITIAMSIMELASGHPRRRPEMSAGEYVSMTIADTGHGIPAELQKLIFEPFYTTKEQGKGTGLGLPTCLGIMEQNGGTIYVESSTNKGTTFRLLLPAIHTEFADEAAQIDVRMPRGTETILFAEDEHMVRDIGVETLRELGYKVHPAANGPEALLFATTFKGTIDILVTDVVMPQMSGRELAEHVQKIRPRIKLLYTSGYTESIISQHGVLDSGVMLLQKPYSPSMLATRVRDILDGNESSDA